MCNRFFYSGIWWNWLRKRLISFWCHKMIARVEKLNILGWTLSYLNPWSHISSIWNLYTYAFYLFCILSWWFHFKLSVLSSITINNTSNHPLCDTSCMWFRNTSTFQLGYVLHLVVSAIGSWIEKHNFNSFKHHAAEESNTVTIKSFSWWGSSSFFLNFGDSWGERFSPSN